MPPSCYNSIRISFHYLHILICKTEVFLIEDGIRLVDQVALERYVIPIFFKPLYPSVPADISKNSPGSFLADNFADGLSETIDANKSDRSN